jgi:uncharacterized membrane protein YbhN (UPF0104 family)
LTGLRIDSRGGWRGVALAAAKLIAAAVLMWLVLRKIDLNRASAIIMGLSAGTVATALALLVVQAVLSAWRWVLVAAQLRVCLPFAAALRLFTVSLFYNQALPSTVPGDMARVWGAARFSTLQMAAVGVFIDRLLTLLALLLLAAGSLSLLAMQRRSDIFILAPSLLLAAALAALAAAVVARQPLRRMLPGRIGALVGEIGDSLHRLFSSRHIFGLGVLSLVIHGLGIATFYVLARGMGLGLGPFGTFIVTPIVLLSALLPISVNGWGVREATMILVLAVFGIGRTEAAILSIAFGIFQLVLGLAGGLILLFPTRGTSAKAGATGP